MMFKVELHPEVVKFLRSSGTIWTDKDNKESFIVNNSWYKPTDEPGIYTVEFLKQQHPEQ